VAAVEDKVAFDAGVFESGHLPPVEADGA
jgi:hypothetical protein